MIEMNLDPNELEPINIVNKQRVAKLAKNMKKGWAKHRRLLVEEVNTFTGPEYVPWTGSHRIEAARLANLASIPCAVMPAKEAEEAFKRAGYDPIVRGVPFPSWYEYVSYKAQDGSEDARLVELRKTNLDWAIRLFEEEIVERRKVDMDQNE